MNHEFDEFVPGEFAEKTAIVYLMTDFKCDRRRRHGAEIVKLFTTRRISRMNVSHTQPREADGITQYRLLTCDFLIPASCLFFLTQNSNVCLTR